MDWNWLYIIIPAGVLYSVHATTRLYLNKIAYENAMEHLKKIQEGLQDSKGIIRRDIHNRVAPYQVAARKVKNITLFTHLYDQASLCTTPIDVDQNPPKGIEAFSNGIVTWTLMRLNEMHDLPQEKAKRWITRRLKKLSNNTH